MDKRERIKELVSLLNEAARAYYQEARELMPNMEYDRLYDELLALEQETGLVLSSSPSRKVGYEVLSALPKKEHESRMLSLDKTKEPAALLQFLGEQKGLLSWKLDGLTVVLRYADGELQEALTRGNGSIGEVVTNNARYFTNLPLHIAHSGELLIRGEAVISYPDFERLNALIEDAQSRYKNPRNLCSGSVRQLNPAVTRERKVAFYAFSLVRASGFDAENSREKELQFLSSLGFEVVEYHAVTQKNLLQVLEGFREHIQAFPLPSDGLVLNFDDIAYGDALGETAKFPRNALAFKWSDEQKETTLLDMEWSPSRTGLINPVAIFEAVDLEGTSVSRAGVHNISMVKSLELGIGDTIRVYKANMIIPQISDNLTRSGSLEIPQNCPACKGEARLKDEKGVMTLHCINPDCPAKHIKLFALAASRDMLDIEGLSEASLEKFMTRGFVGELADLFKLQCHKDEIIKMEGFGERSYRNLEQAIEKARKTELSRLLSALGIAGIGSANAKALAAHFGQDIEALRKAGKEELQAVEGIGEILAEGIYAYFRNEENSRKLDNLLRELELVKPEEKGEAFLAGKSFVITGSVEHFKNRKELQDLIESKGGKVASAVSSRTDYLINNDVLSASSKNKKARELGVAVISEQDFLQLLQEEEEK